MKNTVAVNSFGIKAGNKLYKKNEITTNVHNGSSCAALVALAPRMEDRKQEVPLLDAAATKRADSSCHLGIICAVWFIYLKI